MIHIDSIETRSPESDLIDSNTSSKDTLYPSAFRFNPKLIFLAGGLALSCNFPPSSLEPITTPTQEPITYSSSPIEQSTSLTEFSKPIIDQITPNKLRILRKKIIFDPRLGKLDEIDTGPTFSIGEASIRDLPDSSEPEWMVPERGLAVIPSGLYSQNSAAIVYGHSKWGGTTEAAYSFLELTPQDKVELTDSNTGKFRVWTVKKMVLINPNDPPEEVFGDSDKPTVFLLTSAKTNDDPRVLMKNHWLHSRDALLLKSSLDPSIKNIDDPKVYLSLLVRLE